MDNLKEINDADLKIDIFYEKKKTCLIRVTHIPSGIIINYEDYEKPSMVKSDAKKKIIELLKLNEKDNK